MRYILQFLFLFLSIHSGLAQQKHQIKVNVSNYDGNLLQIAYYLQDKQYLLPDAVTKSDSLYRNAEGAFMFHSKEPIKPGVHALVFHPEIRIHQFLVTEKDQNIEIFIDYNDMINSFEVKGGSNDNQLFKDYLQFLTKKRKEAQPFENKEDDPKAQEKLKILSDEVKSYQKQVLQKHPNSFAAGIIKANMDIDLPVFTGSKKEIEYKKWQYYKQHYLDNIDLADPKMLRTPFLFAKVDYYVNKLQVQHPDSISKAIDLVLEQMKPAPETFKMYTIHFLNEFAKSKIIGMDAVYVHIVDTYYATGEADWTDPEQLKKIIDNANALKPTLLGKKAPPIKLIQKNGITFNLDDIKSDYTVLFFWEDDCGHCKKSISTLKKEYQQLKQLGVELLLICTKPSAEVEDCWSYAKEERIDDWMLVSIASDYAKVMEQYNIKTTPQIFVLDQNKTIVSKRLAADQLLGLLKNFNKN
ncbi:redoxin domain-containing protein [Aquimarina brevivitae]|uniref:Peroxiredoxin n=1 Tax=Aquimarina brevivitae TaxID=323412 RepID=A0A4Q7P157_9FLAO|nr:redoxin domain-containing protein [Aquimarina brevivitae]RZS93551.1 peroxiredoxin [Aquimarina brevivitae]